MNRVLITLLLVFSSSLFASDRFNFTQMRLSLPEAEQPLPPEVVALQSIDWVAYTQRFKNNFERADEQDKEKLKSIFRSQVMNFFFQTRNLVSLHEDRPDILNVLRSLNSCVAGLLQECMDKEEEFDLKEQGCTVTFSPRLRYVEKPAKDPEVTSNYQEMLRSGSD